MVILWLFDREIEDLHIKKTKNIGKKFAIDNINIYYQRKKTRLS